MHVQIAHVSVYADDPKSAASTLASLIGGEIAPFAPHQGGWVCFLSADRVGWNDEFIEFYPRTTQLALVDGRTHPSFVPVEGGAATGAGAHVNMIVPMSALEIEGACRRAGVPHGWRWEGLMDVWIEQRLMVELRVDERKRNT